MTNLKNVLWRGAVVGVLLGLSGCGSSEPAPEAGTEALVSVESAVCSVCLPTRYTDTEGGFGYTCSEAVQDANTWLNQAMQWQCPAGTCNVVKTTGRCTPVGPYRTDGFTIDVTATYSCCG